MAAALPATSITETVLFIKHYQYQSKYDVAACCHFACSTRLTFVHTSIYLCKIHQYMRGIIKRKHKSSDHLLSVKLVDCLSSPASTQQQSPHGRVSSCDCECKFCCQPLYKSLVSALITGRRPTCELRAVAAWTYATSAQTRENIEYFNISHALC